MMKNILLILCAVFLLGGTSAMAIPYLQLDLGDAYYDPITETVVSSENPVIVYTLVDSTNTNFSNISDFYYLSIALTPQIGSNESIDVFSFTVNSDSDFTVMDKSGAIPAATDINTYTYDELADLIYGTPPTSIFSNPGLLGPHGIFPTWYTEIRFTLVGAGTTPEYNVQDNPGGIDLINTGSLYYQTFTMPYSLPTGYALHFDLYTKDTEGTIAKFAPFSHDAQTVPEPTTMLLLGTGLIGLAYVGRKRIKS